MAQRPSKTEIIKFLRLIGDDPSRDGLLNTPENVIKSLEYCFSGYSVKEPEKVISKRLLINKNNGIILLKGVDFHSFCEHHVLPMIGMLSIGYVADKYIASVGSILRLIDAYTKRLQLQERISYQIAECLHRVLGALGVIVHIEARHMCLMCANSIKFETVHTTGVFSDDVMHKKFLSLVNK